jgi:hypothetical protein
MWIVKSFSFRKTRYIFLPAFEKVNSFDDPYDQLNALW